MDLYIARNGNREGPYSVQIVLDMLSKGELKSDQLAWHAGLTEWVPLSQLLDSTINNPTPPPSKPTTHRLGKASLVIGLLGLIAWPLLIGMAAYGVATGYAERSPLLVAAGLMVLAGLAVNCVGAILGLAGIVQRNYSKTWSIVGVSLNAVELFFMVLILCLGIAKKHQQAAGRSPLNPANFVDESAAFQNTQGRGEARRRHEQKCQYLLGSTWGAYQKVGSRNDKWDAQAKELFTLYSQYLSRSDAGGDETYTRLGDLGAELKSLGCDDPMVRFIAPRFMRPRPAQTIDYAVDCQKVAQELADRGYPTNVVFFAILRASRGTAKVGNEAAKRGLPSADVLMQARGSVSP